MARTLYSESRLMFCATVAMKRGSSVNRDWKPACVIVQTAANPKRMVQHGAAP